MKTEKGEKRGFAFVTIDVQGTVDKIIAQSYLTTNGHLCGVERALSEQEAQSAGLQQGCRGGSGNSVGCGGNFGCGGGNLICGGNFS